MKAGLLFHKSLIGILAIVFSLAILWPAGLARAQDAKADQASLMKTPMMKSLKLENFQAEGKNYTAKLGLKKVSVLVFNLGTEKKPIWNIAIYPKSLRMSSVYKTGGAAVLGKIALANPAVIMSAGKGTRKLAELPKAVQDGIKKVFGSAIKSVTYPAGVNFSFTLDVTKTPGLSNLKSTLGVASTKSPMAGTMGPDFIRYLVNGKAATKKTDFAAVSLASVLKGIKPSKASSSFTASSMFVSYRGAKDGTVGLAGGATITAVVGKRKLTFRTGMRFDPKAKNADTKMISIYGPLVKPLKKAEDFGGQRAAVLNLNAAVMGDKRLAIAFSGTTDKKKPFAVAAKLDKGKIILEQAFAANLTVRDVLGYSQQALDKVPFKNPKKVGNVITGTVTLAGQATEAFVFKPSTKAKHPYLVLIPKAFDFGAWIPRIKGTPLDAAKADKTVMLVAASGGGSRNYGLKDLPKLVSDKIAAVVDRKTLQSYKNKLPIADGVNLYVRVDVKKSATLYFLLNKLGIKEKALVFVGAINPKVFGLLPPKPGKLLKDDKRIGHEMLKTLRIATRIPKPRLAGLDKVFDFAGGWLRFRGDTFDRTKNGELTVVTEIVNTVKVKLLGKTIAMTSQLDLEKGVNDNSYRVKATGTSKVAWQKAFGIPFLNLNNIGLSASLDVDKGGNRSFTGGLLSDIKLASQKLKSIVSLMITNGTVSDVSLKLPGTIDVAKLPGIGKIPGINEFAFKDMAVGIGSMYGTMTWKRIGVTSQVALMPVKNGMTLMFRIKDARLGTIVKQVPAPFGDLKFPATVATFSTVDLDDLELGDLPRPFQKILEGIVTRQDGLIPVFDGVSLIGAVGERDMPKQMREMANKMGVFKSIDGPLILAGGITDFFKVTPKVALYAKMPGLKLPKNQPLSRVISFDGGSADFFVRANLAALAFQVGLGGEMTIRVPHLDDPKKVDKLTFRGELFGSVDAVSYTGSIKAAGLMKGKWQSPFGYSENGAFEDPAFIIGFDTEGAVEFGVGGNMHFKTRGGKKTIVVKGDFLININFSSSIPLPKKLATVFQINEVDLLTLIEIEEALIKGTLTGPMAKGILHALPPAQRKLALGLQDKLRKASFYDIMQLDKIPLPQLIYKDVDLFFATPGAVIPGREEVLNTIGVRASGKAEMKAMGKTVKFFEIDQVFTLAEGMRFHGKLANIAIGGVGLKNAELDIGANWTKGPFFKIDGDASVLPGFRDHVELNFGSNGIWFTFEKKMGALGGIKFDARTTGSDIFRARDFIVAAKASQNIVTLLTKEIPAKLGVPKIVTDVIRKGLPLNIDEFTMEGSLVQFIKGQPVVYKFAHEWFGDRVPPAVVTVKPVWSDPKKAIPYVELAREMTKSFVTYLAAHPVDVQGVNLGLINFEKSKLTAIFTDPAKPDFVLSGKVSNFLGGSRAVDATLSDSGYAFQLKDKIAGGLWDANLRAWSVGGTAKKPDDIKYYGSVSSDFYKWLQQKVGGDLNKSFDAVDNIHKSAQRGLQTAINRVKGISSLIERKRGEARRELENLRRLIHEARKALDHSQWLMDKAERTWRYFQRKHRDARNSSWRPWKWARVAATWALEKGAYVAFKAAELARNASNFAFKGIDDGLTKIPLDLHPKVAPLIIARGVAIGVLQGAKLTFQGAEAMNNSFKTVTNALIKAVTGTKVLVVNKAVFTGSLKQAKADFHINLDIMDQKNLFQRLRINLLNPADSSLRELAVMVTSLIKGEKINSGADSLPPAPKLPVATVTKAQIAAAVVAGIRREAERNAQLAREEQQRRLATLAAAGGNLARGKRARQSSRHNNNPNVGPEKGVDGDTNGHYSAAKAMHTNEEQNPWWEVDLGGHYKINQIVIHNQTDCCQDRLDGAVVMLSDWPFIGNPLTPRGGDNIERHTLGKATTQNFVKVSGRTARFIRVQIPRRTILSVAEIQVWGEPTRVEPGSKWPSGGLAVGKPAHQSSEGNAISKAGLAVDGNLDGNGEKLISHTRRARNTWWEVDLGAHYQIDTITVFNRVDCCTDRLDDVVVMVSDWPFGNSPLDAKDSDNVFRHNLGKTQRVNPIGVRRTGRYVRLQHPRDEYMQLAEVVVNGANKPVNPGTKFTNYVNLAPRSAVRLSSTFPGNNGAANAINGRTNDGPLAHSAQGDRAPWWEIDLGAHYIVEKIKIFNRRDCCRERLAGGTVMVSDWPLQSYSATPRNGDGVQRHRLAGTKRVYEMPVSRTARYVRLQLTSGQFINMLEVEVIGATNKRVSPSTQRLGINVAHGKQARQSSIYANDAVKFGAQKALDGVTDGNFGAANGMHTESDQYAWWEVDLGAHYRIGEIKIHNRTDCCGNRINDAKVIVADWPIQWWMEKDYIRNMGRLFLPAPKEAIELHDVPGGGNVRTLNFNNRSGRYVRLVLPKKEYLNIAEVEVFSPDGARVNASTSNRDYEDAILRVKSDFDAREQRKRDSRIILAGDNTCLAHKGAQIVYGGCTGADSQRFLRNDTGGYEQIRDIDGRCLAADGNGIISMQACANSGNHRWQPYLGGLRNQGNNECLRADGGNVYRGTCQTDGKKPVGAQARAHLVPAHWRQMPRPLYRYFRSDRIDHLYTPNFNELRDGNDTWKLEGIEGFVMPSHIDNWHQFLRFSINNPGRGGQHMYTENEGEARNLRSSGWRAEGDAGFISRNQVKGTTALYRWSHKGGGGTGDHFYTTNPQERPGNYNAEGIAGYVFRSSGAVSASVAGPAFVNAMIKDYAGRCLDVGSEKNRRGARKIVMWGCNGNANQRFTLHANGELKGVDGLCVDPQERDELWAYKCTGHPAMKYRQIGGNRIQNAGNNKCIDVNRNDSRNGQTLLVHNCHGDRNQRFSIVQ